MQVAVAVAVAVATVAVAVAVVAAVDDEDGVQWWRRGGGVQWRQQRSTAMTAGATDRR